MKMPRVDYETILCRGGMDQITPTLNLKPGVCRSAINFECATTGGYTRIGGYERLDGRPSPSAATFLVLTVSGASTLTLGVTITGATSGATGVLIAQTATTFVLTKVVGTFNGTEGLTSGLAVGTQTGFGSVATTKLFAQYKALAADNYRADIAKPTGSGAALGAFMFNDVKYCFRNNAGGTAAVMFKSTTSGWSAITFGEELSFTAASTQPVEGATVTQGSVTAVVRRVVLQSGAFLGGTAAGRLIIDTRAGGNFVAGAFTAGFTATASGAATAITLLPNGKFQFDISNFSGSAGTIRVYGCDGVNRGFEWDGTTFVPITTGQTSDTPKFVAVHKKQLFWAMGSSVVHSAPGLPYDYTALSGASEIATGDTVTGMQVQPGSQTTGAIAIYNRSNTLILYGTGVSSWNLVALNTGTGCIPYTAENLSQSYTLDDRGVFGMATSLNYGNFEQTALTAAIRPFIVQHRSSAVCSVLCREKSQYRVYFSDGTGLHLTIVNGKYLGAMPIYYTINAGSTPAGLYNAWSGTASNGDEVILGCGTDGYVYQLDKGTSFDGANLGASLTLNFDSVKSPRILKRYRKAALEMIGASYAEVSFFYSLGYGRSDIPQPGSSTYSASMLSSNWDTSSWDAFFWDSSDLVPTECEMSGTAENAALTFASGENYIDSYTINSIIVHYTPRRGLR